MRLSELVNILIHRLILGETLKEFIPQFQHPGPDVLHPRLELLVRLLDVGERLLRHRPLGRGQPQDVRRYANGPVPVPGEPGQLIGNGVDRLRKFYDSDGTF